jgi:hypothetical protein
VNAPEVSLFPSHPQMNSNTMISEGRYNSASRLVFLSKFTPYECIHGEMNRKKAVMSIR